MKFSNYKSITEEDKTYIDACEKVGYFDWEYWWYHRLTWIGRLRFRRNMRK